MSDGPAPLARLVAELSRLPGIGQRTAQRLAFHLLRAPDEEAFALGDAIREVKEKVGLCEECFNLTESDRCALCADPRRDRSVICVVEEASDIPSIERSGEYRGLYHVLGGRLAPLDGIGPSDLTVAALVTRVGAGGVKEVIVATNPKLEGEATALYLQEQLRGTGVQVSRLARGLPMGGELEYVDGGTLSHAFSGRTPV